MINTNGNSFRLFLIGGPNGAGKTERGKEFAEKNGFAFIDTGAAVNRTFQLWEEGRMHFPDVNLQEQKKLRVTGKLVDETIVIRSVIREIEIAKSWAHGVVPVGIPRDGAQAERFCKEILLKTNIPYYDTKCVMINIPLKTAIASAKQRTDRAIEACKSPREDDTEPIVVERYNAFQETKDIINSILTKNGVEIKEIDRCKRRGKTANSISDAFRTMFEDTAIL